MTRSARNINDLVGCGAVLLCILVRLDGGLLFLESGGRGKEDLRRELAVKEVTKVVTHLHRLEDRLRSFIGALLGLQRRMIIRQSELVLNVLPARPD